MLEVRNLSVSYGKHQALAQADLRVGRGEIVVILGANGAGKTTLLKAVCGISDGSVSGSVTMEGQELVGTPPEKVVEAGIALVPEGRGVFGDLSVQENLTLGAYSARARDEEAGNLERIYALFPKLRERRKQVVRTMSGGEQQMVAIGRAMMSNPAILALDEPSLGLSPLLCKELFQSLTLVRKAGLGILLVEQNARQSLAIADRGYLLENGEIVHEDEGRRLAEDPAVQKAYLGGGGAASGTAPAMKRPEPLKPVSTGGPRPSAGPAPSDIAAAAMRSVSNAGTRPAPKPAPQASQAASPPKPTPSRTPASPDRPSAPATATSGAKLDLGALVSRASRMSSRRAAPNPTIAAARPRPATEPPPASEIKRMPMPDLASGGDRLRAVLDEIENAARRAESYRPSSFSRDTRK